MNSNPSEWTAPKWHSDFGDASEELEMLKKFCILLIRRKPEYNTELDCFEEGYMKVNIYKKKNKYAELYITNKNNNKRYGLFLAIDTIDEDEIYFSDLDEGLKKF